VVAKFNSTEMCSLCVTEPYSIFGYLLDIFGAQLRLLVILLQQVARLHMRSIQCELMHYKFQMVAVSQIVRL
jgi:hypothetical protein